MICKWAAQKGIGNKVSLREVHGIVRDMRNEEVVVDQNENYLACESTASNACSRMNMGIWSLVFGGIRKFWGACVAIIVPRCELGTRNLQSCWPLGCASYVCKISKGPEC